MDQTNEDFYIVGIGTSAGGLEALHQLFEHMHPDPQLAFVVVQHLSPDYKSHMVALLSRHTEVLVLEATDNTYVEPGTVYILPPRKTITVENRVLKLMDYERSTSMHLPVDIFFESLAQDQKEMAIGIVLSGTGSDGTRGLKMIKEQGGIVIAQDDSARFNGMPHSALSTQLVDFVAAPNEIPDILLRYAHHPKEVKSQQFYVGNQSTKSSHLDKLYAIIQNEHKVDFGLYKQNTILRRIERRMSLNRIESIENYVAFLQNSVSERYILLRDCLIGVTRFFRDPQVFEFIEEEVLANLVAQKRHSEPIRVWVAGCSTGEEAYTLAILLHEAIERADAVTNVKIFATDLSKDAIEVASRGVYNEVNIQEVPQYYRQKYFVQLGDTYEVSREIRMMVVFAQQNILTDPPFSKIDLISCRNLLIYLQLEAQQQVMGMFQFALNRGGILLLGSSESLGAKAQEFETISSKYKVYRQIGAHIPLTSAYMTSLNKSAKTPVVMPSNMQQLQWQNSDTVLRSIIENILPPTLVVNESMHIVHSFGDVEPFLHLPKGYGLNLHVSKLLREDLVVTISSGIHRVFQQSQPIEYANVVMEMDGVEQAVSITIKSFWDQTTQNALVIVTFQVEDNVHISDTRTLIKLDEEVQSHVNLLENQLQFTRENLQATIEELETSNEELQATNEELLASNEELQSTNEELQSVNEELITVNNEFQAKIAELSSLNDDLNNLFKSTDVGTIFLDEELRIRRFTPAVQDAVFLLDQDIDRPIQHIGHQLLDIDLEDAITKVLDTLIPETNEVATKSGQWYLLRIMPYRTYTNQINGVVLTFTDITEMKNFTMQLEQSQSFSESVFNSLDAHIAVLDEVGTIIQVNDAWREFARQNNSTSQMTGVGLNYLDVCEAGVEYGGEGAAETYDNLKQMLAGEIDSFELVYPCHSPTEDRWFFLRGLRLQGSQLRYVISHTDITKQVHTEMINTHLHDQMENLVQAQPLAIFELDAADCYTWLYNQQLPYPPQSAIGQTDYALLNSPVLSNLIQNARQEQQRLQTSITFQFEDQKLSYDVILYAQPNSLVVSGIYQRSKS